MYRLLNDHSLTGQFGTLREFFASLLQYTIPLFSAMEKYSIELAKSERFWQRPVLKNGMTLVDVLHSSGYPEITKFKSQLHRRIMDEPYWQQSFSGQDCLSKAQELSRGLISFKHGDYCVDEVVYSGARIPNCYEKAQLYAQLRESGVITTGQFLLSKHPRILTFCVLQNKDYFADFLNVNSIDQSAERQILEDLLQFMHRLENGHNLGRLTGNIEGNLHEFRTTVFDGREIRILYCLVGPKIAFLNCFVKKQQRIPLNEKNLGIKLKKQALAMLSGA